MLIDHEHRFALIAVPKTGSTSMHYALAKMFGGVSFESKSGAPAIYHMYASDIQRILGPAWEGFYSFATVRNPYDRMVSLWHDFKHSRGFIKAENFEIFVTERLEENWFNDIHFKPQIEFLSAKDSNEVIVKNVAKYEDGVQEAFDHVCRDLSLTSGEQVGHARRSARESYLDYYASRAVIDVINELYRADFDALGYEML